MRKEKENLKLQQILKLQERGITLIALVITIVILIILATVSISIIFGEGGLIDRAQEGKDLTEQAQIDEQEELKGAEEYINGVLAGTDLPEKFPETVVDAKKNGTTFTNTTTIKDDLDNPIKVPGGFNIAEDSGTKVEEGIVIEDDDGNQFVWIPVGEYNVTTEIEQITEKETQDGKITNELTRRNFTESASIPVNGDNAASGTNGDVYYGEGDSRSVAKDQIDAFKTSSTTNKGFYIGRYEAGTEIERGESTDQLTMPLVQANKYPYKYVSRDEAKSQSESIYSGNDCVTSELISSYAWDTALNFICQTNEEGYLLATTTDSNYGNIGTGTRTLTGEYTVDEGISDKYSNIFDILGNYREWTSEYSSDNYLGNDTPCVNRGGYYVSNGNYVAIRNSTYTTSSGNDISFRIQLYINNESE